MKNKILSVIVSITLIIACFAGTASAKSTFSDVLTPDHDWASKQIEEMSELGIIKGYTDGTFKPDNAINKIEALLLFSRVAGFSDSEYSAIVDYAFSVYEPVLEEINLGNYKDFKKELAFLIYKGILSDEEITEYLEDKAYKEEFPRSDAAILLASLMDAEVKKVSADSLDFDDAKEIPEGVLGYINYVVKEGLMNGVEKDDGSIVFDAEGALSRAQVSVLLYRIIDKLQMSVEAGTVDKIDEESGIIKFTNSDDDEKSYVVPEDAKIIINGKKAELTDIVKKSEVCVIRHGKEIYAIEAISPVSNETLSGTIVSKASKSTYAKLEIKLEETGEKQVYYTKGAGDFTVTSDGVAADFSDLEINDYVVIKLLDSVIVSIDRQSTEATVQGTLEDITFEDPIELTVITVDETTDKETTSVYTVDDDVSVRCNGERASLSEVFVGDKVVLTITRGKITKIVATTAKSTATGTVSSITIASQSKIVLSSGGESTEYPVSLDADFMVGGKEGSIYDLRLGNSVTVSLSGKTVTKVEQTASSSSATKSGTIDGTSTSYGYINIILPDGSADQIFAAKTGSSINAKIINGETGKDLAFKELKKGDFIIATGSYSNGGFVAKTIVVTKPE